MITWSVADMGRLFVLTSVIVLFAVLTPRAFSVENDTAVAVIGIEGVQKANILAREYYFKPSRIVVQVNIPVELRVMTEKPSAAHRFVLMAPEAGINISVPIGRDARMISFTPKKRGEYAFYCERKSFLFGIYRKTGMDGVLVVI